MIGKQIVRQPPLTNPIDVLLADVAIRVQLNRTDYDKLVDRYQTINRWIEREGSPLKGTNAVRRAYTRSASSRRVP